MAQQISSRPMAPPVSLEARLAVVETENAQLRASLRAVREALAELQLAWRERAAEMTQAAGRDRLTYADDGA
jgi:hypothetical protein